MNQHVYACLPCENPSSSPFHACTSHSTWQRIGSAQHGLPEVQNQSLVLPSNPEPTPLLIMHQNLNHSSYHLVRASQAPGTVRSALYYFI